MGSHMIQECADLDAAFLAAHASVDDLLLPISVVLVSPGERDGIDRVVLPAQQNWQRGAEIPQVSTDMRWSIITGCVALAVWLSMPGGLCRWPWLFICHDLSAATPELAAGL